MAREVMEQSAGRRKILGYNSGAQKQFWSTILNQILEQGLDTNFGWEDIIKIWEVMDCGMGLEHRTEAASFFGRLLLHLMSKSEAA